MATIPTYPVSMILRDLEAFCRKNKTYAKAAPKLGLTPSQLSQVRTSKIAPSDKVLKKLGYEREIVYVKTEEKKSAKKGATPRVVVRDRPVATRDRSGPIKPGKPPFQEPQETVERPVPNAGLPTPPPPRVQRRRPMHADLGPGYDSDDDAPATFDPRTVDGVLRDITGIGD